MGHWRSSSKDSGGRLRGARRRGEGWRLQLGAGRGPVGNPGGLARREACVAVTQEPPSSSGARARGWTGPERPRGGPWRPGCERCARRPGRGQAGASGRRSTGLLLVASELPPGSGSHSCVQSRDRSGGRERGPGGRGCWWGWRGRGGCWWRPFSGPFFASRPNRRAESNSRLFHLLAGNRGTHTRSEPQFSPNGD